VRDYLFIGVFILISCDGVSPLGKLAIIWLIIPDSGDR
jgi:hypothetical protein